MTGPLSRDTALRVLSKHPLLQILYVIAGLTLAWEVLRRSRVFDQQLLPSSTEIGAALVGALVGLDAWLDLGMTLFRTLGGLLLALLIGIPVGLLVGATAVLRPLGLPLIDFLRSIPVTTLYPVFVLTLGIGDRGKIGMVFLACVSVIALHSATGVERRSLVRHEVARLYGASRFRLLVHVTLPETLPEILTGLRVAVGLALIVSTLTEMFMGAQRGMGQTLMEAYSVYNLPVMYAYIVCLGTTGFAINKVFIAAEAQAHKWSVR